MSTQPTKEPLKVLIAEDTENDALLVLRQLAKDGFEPVHERVYDAEAMAAALDSKEWDIVLSDYSMPQFTAPDALKLVRSRGSDLPFIVVSGTVGENVAVEMMRAGAHDYLMKGNLKRLGEAVRREIAFSKARRESEERFRIITESSPDAIFLTDKRGNYTYANRAASEMLGYSTDELMTMNIADVSQKENMEGNLKKFRELIAKGKLFIELELVRKDGTVVPADLNAVLLPSGEIYGSCRDLTERKKTLMENEALLAATRAVLEKRDFGGAARAIFDIASDYIGAPSGYCAILSEDGNNNDLLFLESGGRACSVDQERPMPIRGLRETAYRTKRGVYENNFPKSPHVELMPEGHMTLENVLFAPLVIDGEAVGLLGLAGKPGGFDDWDLKLAEALGEIAAIALRENTMRKALAQSEERLRAIFESTADYVLLLDREHRVQMINRTEEGVDPDQILGIPLPELAAGTSPDAVKAHLDCVVNTGKKQQYDTLFVRPDGTNVHYNTIASPVVVGGNIDGSVVVSRDVTERKHMEAQLAQADRLSTMGMLAAGVAHEINNPLSYVLYNLESLSSDFPSLLNTIRTYQDRMKDSFGSELVDEVAGEMAAHMNPTLLVDLQDRFGDALEGTQRIRRIVRGLGTFSRVERDQLVPVNIRNVIEAALNMSFNEIKYRARVVKDYKKVPTIMATEGRLSQVFLNLFINAAHAIGDGDVEGNEIRIRTWVEGDTVCAEVRDTGAGIAEEHLSQLFEPFFTTKEVGVGSGLGLPISKGIVEGYGGKIEVESEPGKGTAFQIRIPSKTEGSFEMPAPEAEEADDSATGRILIVDDEDGIRAAMAHMLRGNDVEQAPNGEAARRVLENDQEFDLIICDMMMPGVSGMDLHDWLVTENPRLAKQFVFITGGAFTPKARAYLGKVDNLRLEKPFDVTNFKKIVAELVRNGKIDRD